MHGDGTCERMRARCHAGTTRRFWGLGGSGAAFQRTLPPCRCSCVLPSSAPPPAQRPQVELQSSCTPASPPALSPAMPAATAIRATLATAPTPGGQPRRARPGRALLQGAPPTSAQPGVLPLLSSYLEVRRQGQGRAGNGVRRGALPPPLAASACCCRSLPRPPAAPAPPLPVPVNRAGPRCAHQLLSCAAGRQPRCRASAPAPAAPAPADAVAGAAPQPPPLQLHPAGWAQIPGPRCRPGIPRAPGHAVVGTAGCAAADGARIRASAETRRRDRERSRPSRSKRRRPHPGPCRPLPLPARCNPKTLRPAAGLCRGWGAPCATGSRTSAAGVAAGGSCQRAAVRRSVHAPRPGHPAIVFAAPVRAPTAAPAALWPGCRPQADGGRHRGGSCCNRRRLRRPAGTPTAGMGVWRAAPAVRASLRPDAHQCQAAIGNALGRSGGQTALKALPGCQPTSRPSVGACAGLHALCDALQSRCRRQRGHPIHSRSLQPARTPLPHHAAPHLAPARPPWRPGHPVRRPAAVRERRLRAAQGRRHRVQRCGLGQGQRCRRCRRPPPAARRLWRTRLHHPDPLASSRLACASADEGDKNETGFNACQFGKLSSRWEVRA